MKTFSNLSLRSLAKQAQTNNLTLPYNHPSLFLWGQGVIWFCDLSKQIHLDITYTTACYDTECRINNAIKHQPALTSILFVHMCVCWCLSLSEAPGPQIRRAVASPACCNILGVWWERERKQVGYRHILYLLSHAPKLLQEIKPDALTFAMVETLAF